MNKKYLWIGLGILIFIIVGTMLALWIRNQRVSPQSIIATPMPTVTAFPMPTATVTMVPTPKPTSDVWIVKETEVDVIHENGFDYIVDIFVNEANPNVTIRAHCMGPLEPAPEVGHKYILNKWGVMYPAEGVDSKLQRFLPIK